MSTHARPLADDLAAASDDELTALLTARGVRPDVAWQDLFDAAEALLDTASIGRALPALTAAEAAGCRVGWTGDHGDRARPRKARTPRVHVR